MRRIKHSSLSDYITTLCFFGLTLLSFVKASDHLDEGNILRSSTLFGLSLIFLSASLRFIIAKIYYKTIDLINSREHNNL